MRRIILAILLISCSNYAISQISYLSTPTENSSYVKPFDLNLLGRVNSIKQQRFDSNLKILQDEFKQCLRMLKHIKGENYKACATQYDRIVNTANGNDLSDAGLVNFLLKKLENLENTIDYVIDNPDAIIRFKN